MNTKETAGMTAPQTTDELQSEIALHHLADHPGCPVEEEIADCLVCQLLRAKLRQLEETNL